MQESFVEGGQCNVPFKEKKVAFQYFVFKKSTLWLCTLKKLYFPSNKHGVFLSDRKKNEENNCEIKDPLTRIHTTCFYL